MRPREDGDAEAVADEADHADQVEEDAVKDKLEDDFGAVVVAGVISVETPHRGRLRLVA